MFFPDHCLLSLLTSCNFEFYLFMCLILGAGDFCTTFLPAAVISLAFSTVEAIIKYYQLFPMLFPAIVFCCLTNIFFCALISNLFQTPTEIARSLLTRYVTTAVAVSLTTITHVSYNSYISSLVLCKILVISISSVCLYFFPLPFRLLRLWSRQEVL